MVLLFYIIIMDYPIYYAIHHDQKIYIIDRFTMPPNSADFGEKDINEMLKLEQLFHNKYLTADFLHELVALYVRAIEKFNKQFTFMRGYYLEKMQFVVSRPEIIQLLQKGGDIVQQIRDTMRISSQETTFQDRKFANFQPKYNNNNNHNVTVEKETHHHYHYEQSASKAKQRNLKIDMKVKVMREVEENMKILQENFVQQDIIREKKGVMVKNITKEQQDLLNQRLAKRKNRLRKKSMEIKPQVHSQQPPQPEIIIKKQQLIEAQRQLTAAVMKFTIRMTERQNQQDAQRSPTKGRIKMKKIESINQDDDLLEQDTPFEKSQQKVQFKPTGRIKTRREDEEDESEYW